MRLIKGTQFLNERVFTDVYYDTDSYSLTVKDIWLRSREGRFELKLPLLVGSNRLVDQYDELEDERKIKEALNLPFSGNLAGNLAKAGYSSFCTCKTTRRKYKNGLFTIDLDIVDFQNFTYNIGEIELMINDKSEIKIAIEKIMAFATEQKLTIAPVRGKIIEYLKQAKPSHYQALVQAKVVKDY